LFRCLVFWTRFLPLKRFPPVHRPWWDCYLKSRWVLKTAKLHMILWGTVSRMRKSHPQGQVTDSHHNYSTWLQATRNSYIPTSESFRCMLMGYLLRLTNENSISHNMKIQYSCLHISALCMLIGRVQQVGCVAGIVSACTSKEPATGLSSESTVLWHQWFRFNCWPRWGT
jgi:hypothetical protein